MRKRWATQAMTIDKGFAVVTVLLIINHAITNRFTTAVYIGSLIWYLCNIFLDWYDARNDFYTRKKKQSFEKMGSIIDVYEDSETITVVGFKKGVNGSSSTSG